MSSIIWNGNVLNIDPAKDVGSMFSNLITTLQTLGGVVIEQKENEATILFPETGKRDIEALSYLPEERINLILKE